MRKLYGLMGTKRSLLFLVFLTTIRSLSKRMSFRFRFTASFLRSPQLYNTTNMALSLNLNRSNGLVQSVALKSSLISHWVRISVSLSLSVRSKRRCMDNDFALCFFRYSLKRFNELIWPFRDGLLNAPP